MAHIQGGGPKKITTKRLLNGKIVLSSFIGFLKNKKAIILKNWKKEKERNCKQNWRSLKD